MSFGGFLGMGEDYYPLPWAVLTYNPSLGGYEANITEPQLKNAPKFPGTKAGMGLTAPEQRRSATTTDFDRKSLELA